jgi:penicillin-binding protein 1C
LNGEKLDTSASAFFWTLSPGNWILSAKSGEISDKVTFQVKLATINPTRRGFSVVNPTKSQP